MQRNVLIMSEDRDVVMYFDIDGVDVFAVGARPSILRDSVGPFADVTALSLESSEYCSYPGAALPGERGGSRHRPPRPGGAALRTRDLWFGSHMLSEVSKAAAQAMKKYSPDAVDLIFPVVQKDVNELDEPDINVANRIVAQVDNGGIRRRYRKLSMRAKTLQKNG